MQYKSTEQLRFKQGGDSNLYVFVVAFLNDCSSNSVENGMVGQEGLLESCFHKSIAEYMMHTWTVLISFLEIFCDDSYPSFLVPVALTFPIPQSAATSMIAIFLAEDLLLVIASEGKNNKSVHLCGYFYLCF